MILDGLGHFLAYMLRLLLFSLVPFHIAYIATSISFSRFIPHPPTHLITFRTHHFFLPLSTTKVLTKRFSTPFPAMEYRNRHRVFCPAMVGRHPHRNIRRRRCTDHHFPHGHVGSDGRRRRCDRRERCAVERIGSHRGSACRRRQCTGGVDVWGR